MFLASINVPVPCKRANGDQPSERVSVFTVSPSADRRMVEPHRLRRVRAAVGFGLPRQIANLQVSKLGSSPPMATAPKYDPSRPYGCCSARRFDADQCHK